MEDSRKRDFRWWSPLWAIWCILCCLFTSGCMQNAFLRGSVTDVSGEELPGAVVRVKGTGYEGLSNGNGRYSFRLLSGTVEIEFAKTGYTLAHRTVTVPSFGILDLEPVQLWPLPVGEGVYTFENFQYSQTDHPRVNRYTVQNAGIAYGTPVEPGLKIDYVDPATNPEANPPRLITHKMPAYDAHLNKLRKVKAAIVQTGSGSAAGKKGKEIQYNEEVWIAGEAIPLFSQPLDEPERQLLELRAAQPLSPGVYAVHWGALEGFDSIDPRAFLFSVVNKDEASQEGEGESQEGEIEADKPKKTSNKKAKSSKKTKPKPKVETETEKQDNPENTESQPNPETGTEKQAKPQDTEARPMAETGTEKQTNSEAAEAKTDVQQN